MTEWYFGSDGNLVVQKHQDQELFDRLPSPDSWMQWETSGIGGNTGWENSFDSGNIRNEKTQQQTSYNRSGNEEIDGEHSHDSNNFGGSSEDSHHSLLRNSAACGRRDYYFNDFAETDSADDIFLSSLLEDDALPLQSLYIGIPSNSDSTNKLMDFESISCDTEGVGNLKCFASPNYSYSQGSDSGYSDASKLSSRNDSDHSSPSGKVLETKDLIPSDHDAPMRTSDDTDMSSTEETVLMGLEAVLHQLSQNTRICLRDSMYRLAEHSEQQTPRNPLAEGLPLDEPSLPETTGVCSRSRMIENESETNTIDRAVAYMMFNRMNTNEQDYLPALSPEFVQNGRDFTIEDMDTSDIVQCELLQGHQSYQSDFGAVENAY